MPSLIEDQPPRLSDLQEWLRWIFTEPSGIAAALKGPQVALLRRPEPKPRRLSWIADGPPIDVPQRLAVYADAYFLRLWGALGSDFKAVLRALGDESFRGLVADYLKAHPSTSPNITDVGEAFPNFIKAHALNTRLPFLADLATLEWTFLTCLHTDRLSPLDIASIQNIEPTAWSDARLTLDPTVHLLDLKWPVHKLWDRRDLSPEQGLRRLRRPSRQRILLYRDDDWVHVRTISASEFVLLEKLQQGIRLGKACAALETSGASGEATDIRSWFSNWTANGIVKRVKF